MKDKITKISSLSAKAGLIFALCIVLLISAVLFLLSMVETANVQLNEHITFYSDNIFYNMVCLAAVCIFGTAVMIFTKKTKAVDFFSSSQLAVICGTLSLILGVVWIVQSKVLPTHDSFIVTNAGVSAANGDFSPLQKNYFDHFPFQLGYVLWNELFARLFSVDTAKDFIVLQCVNVFAWALSVIGLIKITDRIFKNRYVTFATSLMLVVFVQPVIFSVFLYGTLPGFVFSVWSVFFFIRYLEKGKIYNGVISAVLISISVCLKLNNMIFAVAMIILFMIDVLKDKRIRSIACAVLMCFLVVTVKQLPIKYYEAKADIEFEDGIPMTCWLSMGLGESAFAPGWYDSADTVILYQKMNGDIDKINEITKENIKERIGFFIDNPADAYDFFKDKTSSQWNETSFQSIWNNNVRGQFGEKTGVAKYVCGDGEKGTKKVMDITVQTVYFGFTCACFYLVYTSFKRKNTDISSVVLLVIIIGGFLYHLLFEAKSQYVLPYVIIMIPYAVYGLYKLFQFLKYVTIKNKQKYLR